MISVFYLIDGSYQGRIISPDEPIPSDAIWIDVLSPETAELELLEQELKIEMPTKNEMWKNHILNRLYMEDDVAYMTAAVINKVDTPYPNTGSITFILTPRSLITIHDVSPTSFKNFAQRLTKRGSATQLSTPADILEGLLEEMITRVAYNSEIVVDTLDELSHHIFDSELIKNNARNTSQLMKVVLKRLGTAADLNSKINESLHTITRMLHFFKQMPSSSSEIDSKIDMLITDTGALTTQTAFLSDKITLQLDATLGMINVEQNLIMKLFSVVSVFLMPPTLISSIYGMNFEFMPELKMWFGYPVALSMMALCGLIPYIYFRRKGWL